MKKKWRYTQIRAPRKSFGIFLNQLNIGWILDAYFPLIDHFSLSYLCLDGYSISGGRSDDLNDCEGEQLHSPVSSAGFHGGLHGFPSRVKSEDRDRRNEFYSLKRFILISLGIPTAPAMKNSCQNLCSKLYSGCVVLMFSKIVGSNMYSYTE